MYLVKITEGVITSNFDILIVHCNAFVVVESLLFHCYFILVELHANLTTRTCNIIKCVLLNQCCVLCACIVLLLQVRHFLTLRELYQKYCHYLHEMLISALS